MSAYTGALIAGAAVAVLSWFASSYCFIRCWLVRPRGAPWIVPVLSRSPALISPAGITWRRRAYVCLIPFLLFWAIGVLLSVSGHPLRW
jgi:hypothetical protein